MIQANSYDTRSKLIQIFRYIQALNQLRHPPQNDINDQPWVLWFHDLPNHPCIRLGLGSATNTAEDDSSIVDEFILKVSRPKLTEPPNPPEEIIPWLKDGWQNIDVKVEINQTIRIGASNQIQYLNFNDDPQRKRLLEEWKDQRERWVDNERPSRRTMDIFEKLYALQSQLERESERFELILGDGLLHWKTESIHHPVLLIHLQLRFNPEIAEFTLFETGQSLELYTAMLQTVAEIKATQIARIREELEQSNCHPLGGEETARFLKRFVIQLSPHGELLESSIVKNNQIPSITRDPVLFLRPRILGISTALEAILDSLPAKDKLPYSLTSLAGITINPNEKRDRIPSTNTKDSPNGEDETILLSRPANAEQLEIAHRLEKYGAVLVQGPPGTGKTHTIANLIGHLLAQGKTVLVTSEKPKALRVLKEKVVETLQPLCVSMLEDDSRKEMESTIDAISERLANTNADKLERAAEILAKRRIELLRLLRETRHQLAEARRGEYNAIIVMGESFPPLEAARYITQYRSTLGWIPGPVTPGIPLPLSIKELLQLYSSNATVTFKDEQELGHDLPDLTKLIIPIDFEQLVNKQAHLLKFDLNYRRDLWSTANQNHLPEEIQQLYKYLIQEIEPLRNLTGWRLAAIVAGREGGAYRQLWNDLLREIEIVYNLAAQAQLWLIKYDPVLPHDCLPSRVETVLDEIIEYLTQGGKLGSLKLLRHRDWKILIDSSYIKNKHPETLEHFQALRYLTHLRAARADLVGRWQRQMANLGGPSANEIGSEPEIIFHQFVEPLNQCLQWYSNIWMPLENELKRHGFKWERFLAEIQVSHIQYGEILRLRTAVVDMLPPIIAAETNRRIYLQNQEKLVGVIRNLEMNSNSTNSTTMAEVVHQLRDSVNRLDSRAYEAVYTSLNDLQAKSEILRLRRILLAKLENGAPAWANAIKDRIGVHGHQNLPGDPEDAWKWRQLYDELNRRAKVSLEELQERIVSFNSELFRITSELVEKKAWAQQVRRTSLEQRRALQGWRELMRKVGKGTGKRAPRLLEEARQLMPICQTAVPVWIMPLSYVARNFDLKRNRFDVVIIDEASQADITALIAVYMGDQVVVVGDDEQVSPMAVGQNLDEVQRLIDEHLQGVPLANLYDGKLSIYGLARTTFEPVCLLEHFRCVSPIIQFSNELSYNGKIKPLRDDSEVQRRPLTVAYQVKSLSKRGKINEEEAYAVASLLIAASEQPEYKEATFGVISMVGVEQAIYIETLLRHFMPATEFINRRVLCGDPAQFQGDERDVMFLSMVDVPGEGPLALRTEEGHEDMFKKRFNVAASRARDQMWVVYSLDTDVDLKPNDIRRRLILHARDQYANNNARRVQEQKIESVFEKQVFDKLMHAGYSVQTQWPVGAYRIDMVVEGNGKRLAVECDGDRWHPQDKLEEDMARQAILERLGWRFVRIRGSQFFRDPDKAMEPVFNRLHLLDIQPEGMIKVNNQDYDGKELKSRIVRRAWVLRKEWNDLQTNSTSQLQPAMRS